MKTKNMRKKALLSSVAMLLIAVVALSGATYAWWTTNQTVSASGMEFKTQTSSALTIAQGTTSGENATSAPLDTNFGSSLTVTWGQGSTVYFTPVSSSFGLGGSEPATPAFFSVSPSTTAAGSNRAQTVNSVGAGSSYIYERIWLKNPAGGAVKVTGLSFGTEKVSGKAITSCLRVGMLSQTGEQVIFANGDRSSSDTWAITGAGTFASSTDKDVATFGDFYDGTVTSVSFQNMKTILTQATSSGTTVCTLPEATAKYVDIYIWLEGNDGGCTDAIAGGGVDSMSITFSM